MLSFVLLLKWGKQQQRHRTLYRWSTKSSNLVCRTNIYPMRPGENMNNIAFEPCWMAWQAYNDIYGYVHSTESKIIQCTASQMFTRNQTHNRGQKIFLAPPSTGLLEQAAGTDAFAKYKHKQPSLLSVCQEEYSELQPSRFFKSLKSLKNDSFSLRFGNQHTQSTPILWVRLW